MTGAEAGRAIAEGNRLRRSGELAAAVAQYRRAVALDPASADARYNLGIALRQAGELRESALAFRAAASLDPNDAEAVQNAVETLAQWAEDTAARFEPTPRPRAPEMATPVSIAVCSIHPERLARMQASFRAALGGRAHEFIVIGDARSLAEGYNRALAAARHPVVVFAHDDVELLSPHPFEALDGALARHDVVGLVGSTRMCGPAWGWAGHPHLFGTLAYPHTGTRPWKGTVYSLTTGVIGSMQAIDGLFFAAKSSVARSLGFDAATFDGFHCYDLDFAYRAHRAGHGVAVTTRVLASHASTGNYDERWRGYAARFAAKFPGIEAPQGRTFWFGRDFATPDALLRFHEAYNALGESA